MFDDALPTRPASYTEYMKALLSWLLSAALLFHSAVAVSMSAASMAHPAPVAEQMDGEMEMPCHQHGKAMNLCEQASCAYQVFCSGAIVLPAMPSMRQSPAAIEPHPAVSAVALIAHRVTPLRPPIPLSV